MARLTPHQADVLRRIGRQSRSPRGYARSEHIGCRSACEHLAEKGYITTTEQSGPRGGASWLYQLTPDGERQMDRWAVQTVA